MEIEKLKVAELRAELSSRGLDTKGTKPLLIARLREAIENEEKAEDSPQASEEASNDASEEVPVEEPVTEEPEAEAEEEVKAEIEPEPMETDKPAEEANKKPEDKAEEKAEETAEVKADEAKPEGKTDEKPASEKPQGRKRKMADRDQPFVVNEDEPEIDESFLCIDWYNSDLNLRINKETFLGAEPFYKDGWGYVWGGARATYGFTSGKLYYEVKIVDNLTSNLEGEKNLHELRLGWSTDDTSFQLGESPNSFAYGASGKKGTDCKFEEYGATFAKDDIVGAFIDLENDPVKMTFTKNGEDQGLAFEVDKADLDGEALFPHISSRNVKFEVNFGKTLKGAETEPWKTPLDGYSFVGSCEQRVRGSPRIEKREECEMIMLVGLPGSGKTTWVNKHVEENPDKRYYVIGTSALINKMKVDGEPRKKHHEGPWDQLIQKCTRCLQDWLRLASQRRRNIIIDQTNVYPNGQKRKVRPFEGMIRKAVVIVPSEDDYKARIEAQEKAENKEVPDTAIMEMKANFALPEEGDSFKEIIFTDLNREEAGKLVEEYNKDAKDKGFGKKLEKKLEQQRKRQRMLRMNRQRMMRRGGRMMRGGPPGRFPFNPRGNMRGGPPRGFMRGGPPQRPPMRFGGPPMRGGPIGPPGRGAFNRGGGRGGPRGGGQFQNRFQGGGNKFAGGNQWGAGGGGQPAPWSQWQQQPQQRAQQGWGMWNQGPNQGWGNNQGNFGGGRQDYYPPDLAMAYYMYQMHSHMGGYGGGGGAGGGGQHYQNNWGQGGGGRMNQGGQYNNQGYPGSQNWGGFGR